MGRIFSEVIAFLYATVVACVGLVLFSILLDLLCYIVSDGWLDPIGDPRVGTWPVLTGTTQRIFLTPFVYTLGVMIGFGGIVRMMMGSWKPRLLQFVSAKTSQ